MSAVQIVDLVAAVGLLMLAIVAALAVLKLPPLLRDVIARQQETNASLREIRAALRKLTDS